MIAMLLAMTMSGYAQQDSLTVIETGDSIGRLLAPMDSIVVEDTKALLADSTSVVVKKQPKEKVKRDWNTWKPDPQRALWLALVIPGAGQIYNRKYWKLPIIYGGYLGLIYGYRWNQKYYRTYANAYRDLMLGSPNASYRDFLPPNYDVESHRSYLEKAFKRKRNTYRNYRDYCLVGMIGVYLVSIVDAYVDASLYHFDVSTDLDANNRPTLMVGYRLDF